MRYSLKMSSSLTTTFRPKNCKPPSAMRGLQYFGLEVVTDPPIAYRGPNLELFVMAKMMMNTRKTIASNKLFSFLMRQ